MAFSFKSVGHFMATFFKAAAHDVQVVEQKAPGVISDIEKTQATVDKVLPNIPEIGGVATTVADLGYAALGELAAVITTGTAAQQQALANSGLDNAVITAVEAAVKSFGSLGAFVESLSAKKAA